ncbi:MAG: hypothetical protein Q7R47_05715, partial [Candidatus Diapherotrites archaeon]|nr:hypothetical protein [Candidatus Diapherotrites archaeon]
IKNCIEIRVCDSLPPMLIPSFQALVKAFVYHPEGRRAMEEITRKWTFDNFNLAYENIARDGLRAKINNIPMLQYCKEVLDIATANLRAVKILDEDGEDESIHLRAIKEFVLIYEQCPGQWVRNQWHGEWKQNPERLIEWSSFK